MRGTNGAWILAVAILVVLGVLLLTSRSKYRPFSSLQDCPTKTCDCTPGESNTNSVSEHEPQMLTAIQEQTKYDLVQDIRQNWLKPPSYKPYDYTNARNESNMQAVKRLHKTVLAILKNKKNGFFVECGGYDGLFLSNTLHLEQDYQWTGLLVEADPENFQVLFSRNRKCWSINACLAIRPVAEKIKMMRIKQHGAYSSLSETGELKKGDKKNEEFDTQCFPLTSILAALGQTLNVDYFSLDIEGAELKVLQTVPWDYVYIKVISLEANSGRIPPLKEYLLSKNYLYGGYVRGNWIFDHVFVHKSFEAESGVKIADIQNLLAKG